MIYSRWDPTTGLYDYLETERAPVGLNDDLPVPSLPRGTSIGVPSVECGRPLPPEAIVIGKGELARGSIVPPIGARELAGGMLTSPPWLLPLLGGAIIGGLLVYFVREG